jgi:L-amino acid N-acyltransferase YncA
MIGGLNTVSFKETAMDKLVEILSKQYPKKVVLEDNSEVTFRPLRKDDEGALSEFFRNLPLKDRACLKEDVTDPKVIENWIYNLDYDNVLPIIAVDNGKIAGDATLHFNTIGWTKHQAEIRLTTDITYRGKGLGTGLARDIIDIAKQLGIEMLSIEMAPQLQEAFSLFEKLGFTEAAVLKGFISDIDGNELDLVLMIKRLNK